MAVTITVLSQKGGTGKTTTVRTLADAYRRSGLEVLAWTSTRRATCPTTSTCRPTLADDRRRAGRPGRAADAVYDDVLPANLGLAEAELVLGGKMGRELTLKRALRDVSATTTWCWSTARRRSAC